MADTNKLPLRVFPSGLSGWECPGNGMCYWYARETVTWDRARQKCRENNAKLVKITSSSKNRLIGDMIKTNIWIGLNDRVEAGKHTMGHRSNVKYWEGSFFKWGKARVFERTSSCLDRSNKAQ